MERKDNLYEYFSALLNRTQQNIRHTFAILSVDAGVDPI